MDHVAHFYGADHELITIVAGFLAEAIAGGGTAVAIAEARHAGALEQALADQGVDVAAADRDGALIFRDAAASLRALQTSAGDLDRARFEGVIGELIRAAAARGGPVRAYGEMVALLWERDECGQALELETYWSEFGTQTPFDLYCGYRLADVQGADDTLRQVAALHTVVHDDRLFSAAPGLAPLRDVVRFYHPNLHSPTAARSFVRETLESWGDHAAVCDAQLVVSELAANAVMHARTAFHVRLCRTPSSMQISVSDSSSWLPMPQALTPHQESGRGLQLVHTLTTRWGVTSTPCGKTVWATLPVNHHRVTQQ
jgi:anti-sigma regulatory factor (Ser/Thr protein kinase)